MRIRKQLLMYITLYIAIPFLIFAAIAIYLVYDASLKREQEHFTRNISRLSKDIDQSFLYLKSNLHIFAHTLFLKQISMEENRRLLQTFFEEMEGLVLGMYMTDEYGQVIASYPKTTPAMTHFPEPPRLSQISKEQHTYFSDQIFTDENRHSAVLLIEPLFLDKTFRGTIAVEFSFDMLQNVVETDGYKDYSYFLADSRGNILFSNRSEELPASVSMEALNLMKPFQMEEIHFQNEKQFVTTSPIENTPYTLLALVPKRDFLYPVFQLQIQFIIWVLFSIFSLFFIGYLIRRSIIDPIENLVKVTKKVTTGDLFSFNDRIIMENKGELNELSNHFSQMMAALKLREERLYNRRTNLIQTLIELLEINDFYTAGHSYRVYRYASLIADQLGLSKEQIQNIETAALLHDIGKIGVPEDILNKKGKLNDQEFHEIKKHSLIGAKALERIDDFDIIRKAILHHHEHYNGQGYPYQIRGEAIPLESRIISVADAFDAMISDRPYRSGMRIDQAYKLILKESGNQFDPNIVQAFHEIYENNRKRLEQIHQTFQQISLLAN